MSDRLCGYCRGSGHNRSNCLALKDQIDLIRRTVPAQRRAVHEFLIKIGAGTGAIVSVYNYFNDGPTLAVIPSLNVFESYGPVEYKNIKYEKSVRSTFTIMPGTDVKSEYAASFIRKKIAKTISVPCYMLEDMSRTLRATFPTMPEYRSSYERYSEIMSDSHDSDAQDSTFLDKIALHPRLTSGPEVVTGIKTW